MKKILTGFAILIVIIAIGGYFLSANLDSIVKVAVEKYGTAATGTQVKLEGVKIVLTSGEASLSGLTVGTPAGFDADQSFSLGLVSIKLDPASVKGSGPIVVKDITIRKPQIVYEVNAKGENNLSVIGKNAQAYAGSFGGKKGASAQEEASPAEKEEGRKIIIENLTVEDGQVSVSQAMLLKDKKLSVALPAIHLTNIGKATGGATPAEVAQKILGTISNAAAQAASSSIAKELNATIEKATENMSEESAKDIGGQLIDGLFGK